MSLQSYIHRKRAIFDKKDPPHKKNTIMKKVDFERSCASFNLCLSFLPVLCVWSLQVLWGNWLHNQTFPKLVAAAQSGVKLEGGEQKKLDAEIFLYLDC